MAMWPPVAAYFACGWCLFEGFQREDDGATRFGGYADAAEQIFLELGLYKKSGCMGYSEFPRILSYMSYSDVWELPIYHASLYGIVQGFMAVLLSDYSGSDCPQHDVCLQAALVDRSRVAAALPYVVVDDDLLAPGRTFNNDVRHQAQGNLLRCASLVEQHLPESLFTYSLHILVCRLYKQEEARGCIATCGKLGAERGTQLIGKGSKLKHGALTDAVQHVTQYLHRMGQRRARTRVSFYPKLRFITRHGSETLYIAETVLAVDVSELDTKLVTAKEGDKLYGIVYKNTSGTSIS
ncbi:hypothetical protein WJX77_012618 [Trebouxia sp. C0004]